MISRDLLENYSRANCSKNRPSPAISVENYLPNSNYTEALAQWRITGNRFDRACLLPRRLEFSILGRIIFRQENIR